MVWRLRDEARGRLDTQLPDVPAEKLEDPTYLRPWR
jgi:hypothetical protein